MSAFFLRSASNFSSCRFASFVAHSLAALPATASILRIPAAIASSRTIRNASDLARRANVRAAA